MSKKQQIRQELINKFLNQFKFIKEDDSVAFFEELYKKASSHGMTDLSLLFDGYRFVYEKDYGNALSKFIASTEENKSLSYSWNGLGIVYRSLNDYPKAEEAYRKAIKLDNKYPHPWNGLGNVYAGLNDYSNAEFAYRKAIDLDDKLAYPWNGLGNIYVERKDYNRAKEAFHKAIELDSKDAYPWNGLGIVYRDLKDYPKAGEAFRKAIELDDKFVAPFFSYGLLLLFNLNQPHQAVIYFKKALSLSQQDKDPYLSSITKSNLKIALEKVKEKDAIKGFRLSQQDKDPYLSSITKSNLKIVLENVKEKDAIKGFRKDRVKRDQLVRLLSDTERFEKEVFDNQKAFQSFVVKEAMQADESLYLKVLRRWNSYTPIVADNYHIGKGGGYFLKIQGKGIVIDPGFNFIDNFKNSGYSFDEIDVVMISHAHNDHTSDLESILTLLNNCNMRRKGLDDFTSEDTIRADIAKKRGVEISKVSEDEIEQVFLNESPRRKTIDLYITKSVDKKFGGMLKLHAKADYTSHVIEKDDEKRLLSSFNFIPQPGFSFIPHFIRAKL